MKFPKMLKITVLMTVASVTVLSAAGTQASDKAGAFVGGMIASNVLRNMNARTQAQQQQAQYSQVPQAAPAPQQTAQQRLDQLDKLAAGGYISPEEYKTKKEQILNSM